MKYYYTIDQEKQLIQKNEISFSKNELEKLKNEFFKKFATCKHISEECSSLDLYNYKKTKLIKNLQTKKVTASFYSVEYDKYTIDKLYQLIENIIKCNDLENTLNELKKGTVRYHEEEISKLTAKLQSLSNLLANKGNVDLNSSQEDMHGLKKDIDFIINRISELKKFKSEYEEYYKKALDLITIKCVNTIPISYVSKVNEFFSADSKKDNHYAESVKQLVHSISETINHKKVS